MLLFCCQVTIYVVVSVAKQQQNVDQNASGSCHPTWNRNRENTSPPTSEETVAFAWMHTFQDTFKLQEQTWGRWDIQQNVSAKMHLVPVIQLEIEIARTRRHQLLRRQSHSPECILSKTLSNFKNRHEVVEIFNKMCRQNCIWFQSSNLKTETARQRRM